MLGDDVDDGAARPQWHVVINVTCVMRICSAMSSSHADTFNIPTRAFPLCRNGAVVTECLIAIDRKRSRR